MSETSDIPPVTYTRTFYWSGRRAGDRQTGVLGASSPEAAVLRLMQRGFSHAAVFEAQPSGARIQVGGIHQERKGARREPWYDTSKPAVVR